MHKFVRSLITEWRKLGLPFAGETIVVAVSGGADSLSLMLAIDDLIRRKKLSLQVVVAHFNHKLRGRESDGDEKFVRDLAADLGLEFVTGSQTIALKGNLEQNARRRRYAFLQKTASRNGAAAVLTAHTKNDQAETLLMNLIRGSGADGLGGMSSVRDMEDGVILVRPLLSWATRSDTESYCVDRGLEYRTDRMNDDEAFTRVRIRKTVIPMLAELNPRIVETLARTADLMRRGEGEKGRKGEGEKGRKGDGEKGRKGDAGTGGRGDLKLAELKSMPKSDLYDLLRGWLRESRGDLRGLQLKHIEAIERLISSRKSGKTVELPGGGRVVKQAGRLVLVNIKVEK